MKRHLTPEEKKEKLIKFLEQALIQTKSADNVKVKSGSFSQYPFQRETDDGYAESLTTGYSNFSIDIEFYHKSRDQRIK